jgi:hypothetical protein
MELTQAPTVSDRTGYARCALSAHRDVSGMDADDDAEAVVHLLADLMHLALTVDADFAALLSAAHRHFCEEHLLAAELR